VLLLNAADLTPRWSAELKDVHDGIFPSDETVTESNFYEPGNAFYVSPGLAFAPDQDVLYIVHADSEQLTTVDFENQMVRTVDIEPKLTWFEKILSSTAGTARAKVADGITRQAVISPDGQFLYVTGINSETFDDQNGNWQMDQTPLGLEILQTSDGSRVERMDTDATEVSISPDGRFLYLKTWGSNLNGTPQTETFDTSNGQTLTQKPGIAGQPALLVNGEYLLVSTYTTSDDSHHMSVLSPDGSNVLAEWTASTYVWWLTTP
jgi:hypothetical protein